MSFSFEPTRVDHWSQLKLQLRHILRRAVFIGIVTFLFISMLSAQSHTAHIGLYTHPLESALRAAGVKGVPTVIALAWTGYQPAVQPTMGELKRRAQAVARNWSSNEKAELSSSADENLVLVRYVGKSPNGLTYSVSAQYQNARSGLEVPGSVLVTLEVSGQLDTELRALENKMRRALRQGAQWPWSDVEAWVTLSGTTTVDIQPTAVIRAAQATGARVVRTVDTQGAYLEPGQIGGVYRGFSPRLAPAWRLGEQSVNVEILVQKQPLNRRSVVQVGSPLVLAASSLTGRPRVPSTPGKSTLPARISTGKERSK